MCDNVEIFDLCQNTEPRLGETVTQSEREREREREREEERERECVSMRVCERERMSLPGYPDAYL